ncbi:MerR family transcriptional regulator (plasmid) [Burkholderia sp. THE68]|uniref:MerR family transcriptional regulator n=1 Tax=Burkholderiaceae TaxID=119060 RepID=UPI0013185338|nr:MULTISPECIES: MerR family transcriptional regulator [Burkholderiaceae]BBU33419.1 MerR family transcriptional regulator [Burkholderia sp. THE68]BCQ28670.1 MerR family transcriptional regulator [Caballeronia sp. NK8]BCQ30224.1 MerR family transcriptional regulator [Caballeronia sp. NK8]
MKIGELAARTGIAASRIRFYEGIGLLEVQRQSNGYRIYPPEAVLMLDLIGAAQQAGFSLDEIRMLLPPDLTQWKHGTLVEALRSKVRDIEAMEVRLAKSKQHLVTLLDEIEAKPEEIDCATNAKRLLSRMQSGELKRATATDDTTKRHRTSRRRSVKVR